MGEKKRKEAAKKANFIFSKKNYRFMLIGIGFIALGFILMIGGVLKEMITIIIGYVRAVFLGGLISPSRPWIYFSGSRDLRVVSLELFSYVCPCVLHLVLTHSFCAFINFVPWSDNSFDN